MNDACLAEGHDFDYVAATHEAECRRCGGSFPLGGDAALVDDLA